MRRLFNGLWDRSFGRLAQLTLSQWVMSVYLTLSVLYWGTTLCASVSSLTGSVQMANDANWIVSKCPTGTGTFLLFGVIYLGSCVTQRLVRWWSK